MTKPPRRKIDERQRDERNHCKHRVGNEQNCGYRKNLDHIGQGDGNHHDEALDLHQVAGCPTHQLPRLCGVVITHVQADYVTKEPLAKEGFCPPTFAKRYVATHA